MKTHFLFNYLTLIIYKSQEQISLSVEIWKGTIKFTCTEHKLSLIHIFMEELELGIGDEIEVYKANMIIPQIAKNLTRSGKIEIPKACPVCGGKTEVRQVNDAKSLDVYKRQIQ